jgi:hypothetical protein
MQMLEHRFAELPPAATESRLVPYGAPAESLGPGPNSAALGRMKAAHFEVSPEPGQDMFRWVVADCVAKRPTLNQRRWPRE